MKNKCELLIVVTVIFFIGGCANTAEYLRAQPSTYFPSNKTIVLPAAIKDFMKIHCMKAEENRSSKTDADNGQCLYISADASLLDSATLTKDQRNQVIQTLITISDMNCSTFLQRAFANRAGFDFGKKFFQDLTTAASAGTASVSAPLSAALDATNLVVGKGVDSFNSIYYYDKTFQAMEAAIEAERLKRLAYITAKQADDSYSINEALSDIRAYDDACSFKAGLARLISVAEKGKKDSENGELEVQTATDKNKLTTYKNQFVK